MKKKATSTKTTSKVGHPDIKKKAWKGIDPLLLEAALYKAEDDFDKAVCKFMIIGNSLKTMKEDLVINGTKVELGVWERRMTKEVRGWFKEWGWKFHKEETVPTTDKRLMKVTKEAMMTITFGGVPIEVKFIKNVVRPYTHPDVMYYKVAQFQIPNPWRLAV